MNDSAAPQVQGEHCWQEIGVWGDQSCSRLKDEVHCHNCNVFNENSRLLFQRAAPQDYLEEWSQVVADETKEILTTSYSIVTFRIGREWYGLTTGSLVEVHHFIAAHRLPHAKNPALLGLVNIRGALQICVSLRQLLSAPDDARNNEWKEHSSGTRLAVIEQDGEQWACKLDEIDGIYTYTDTRLRPPPVTVTKGQATFTKGIATIQGKSIALLDEELLFHYLKHNFI